MRKRMAVVAVLAMSAGLALSACDGGDEPTDPTTPSTTTESATTTEPTTEASSDAPTPPDVEAPTPADEVLVDDHVGAIWAARYFFDLYAYMLQTGDTAQFQAMSSADCEFCASVIAGAVELHEAGGWIEGGEIAFDVDDAAAEYPSAEVPNYQVRFSGSEAPSVTHGADGTLTPRDGRPFEAVVALQYVDGRFVVSGVNIE